MKTYRANHTAEVFQAYVDAAEAVEYWEEQRQIDMAAAEYEIRTSPLIFPGDVEAMVTEAVAEVSGEGDALKRAREREVAAERTLRKTLAEHGVPLEKLDNDAIRAAVGTAVTVISPVSFKDLSVADFSAFTRAVARFASDRTKTGVSEIEREAFNLINVAHTAEFEEWLENEGKPDYVSDVGGEAVLDGLEIEEIL